MKLLHVAQVVFGAEGVGDVGASSAIKWGSSRVVAYERVNMELQHSDQRPSRRNIAPLWRLAGETRRAAPRAMSFSQVDIQESQTRRSPCRDWIAIAT